MIKNISLFLFINKNIYLEKKYLDELSEIYNYNYKFNCGTLYLNKNNITHFINTTTRLVLYYGIARKLNTSINSFNDEKIIELNSTDFHHSSIFGSFIVLYINKENDTVKIFSNNTNYPIFYTETDLLISDNDEIIAKLYQKDLFPKINYKIATSILFFRSPYFLMKTQNIKNKQNKMESFFDKTLLLNTNTILEWSVYHGKVKLYKRIKKNFNRNYIDIINDIYISKINYYKNKNINIIQELTGGMDSRMVLALRLKHKNDNNVRYTMQQINKGPVINFDKFNEDKLVLDIIKKYKLPAKISSTISEFPNKGNNVYNHENDDIKLKFSLAYHRRCLNIRSNVQLNLCSYLDFKKSTIETNINNFINDNGKYAVLHGKYGELYRGNMHASNFYEKLPTDTWEAKMIINAYKNFSIYNDVCKNCIQDKRYFLKLEDVFSGQNYSIADGKTLHAIGHIMVQNPMIIDDIACNSIYHDDELIDFYLNSLKSNISENDISENDISENDISENDISENDISENDISKNDISKNDIFYDEIFHYNSIKEIYGELLEFDFMGQSTNYSDNLVKKMNPSNKKVFAERDHSLQPSKNRLNENNRILEKDDSIFKKIIEYYNNDTFNKIIDNDVLIEMLNEPEKKFIICCKLVNLCILTSDKYWNNQDIDFEISFSLY
jgi:hypothetical protein